MLKLLNLRVLLLSTLFITSFFVNDVKSQVTEIDYQIRYNDQDCLWDFYIIIVSGNATTVPQRAQFNAQYSFVVPTGTVVGNPIGNLPIQNNQAYNGTVPTEWSFGAPAINPAASPGNDFYPVAPKLAPASFFNNLAEGDTVKIFSINMSIVPNCGAGVRVFDNINDPNSSAPGMGGGNFSNGYTLGSPQQLYDGNEPTVAPSPPVVSAENLCSPGLLIDLTASTSACQEPITYNWTGPNGFASTDEDVSIPSATLADAGTYNVTVSDAFGCETILTFEGEVKPEAGEDITGCASSTSNLQGAPTTGTWSSDANNPAGGTLNPGADGAATVDFSSMAIGDYTYIYTGTDCSDSLVISIVSPDAGPDPADLTCFSSGTATISAVGTGTWSIGAGSAGTATIANPMDATTTVNDFSVSGTYFLVWDIGPCSDTVTIVTNDNCDCAISNNSLQPITPNSYCGTSGNITIDGGTVTASGAYAWEYSLDSAPFSMAPGANTNEDYTTEDLTSGNHSFRRVFTTDTGVICADTSNIVSFTVTDNPVAPENLTASPEEICESETSTVSVDNVTDAVYTWTVTPTGSGAFLGTTNFITLDPFMPGVYTVTVFSTINGCPSPTSTIDVTVNEVPPTPDDITGVDPTVCEASDGAITIVGYNPSETYTVSYDFMGTTNSPSLTSDANGNIVITGLGAGTYSNFQIISDEGCASDVAPTSVVLSDPAAPDNPTGLMAVPNPECLGLPITITVDDVPGATYNWSASSPNAGLGTSTTNTIEMNATAAGIYNIFVSLTLSGCTSIDTFTSIQVNDAPPAPSPATVSATDPGACGANDGFITLSGYAASETYDVTYSTNGTPTTITLNSNSTGVITIPDLTEGTYSDFSVTNFTGCSSGVFAGPVSLADPGSPDAPANLTATPNPVCLGNTVTLSVDNTIGATYNWSASSPDAGLGTSTGNTISMNPTAAGTYMINVSVTVAGCTSMSSSVDVVVGDTPPTPSGATGTDPTVCAGSDGFITIPGYIAGNNYSITYNDNGTPTNFMATANGLGELIISDLSAGNYSDFVVTNAANCPSDNFAGPINLVDPAAPDAPTGLMTSTICQGETTTLSVDATPGATYSWSVSPADAGFDANTTNTITFTPTADGIFSVSVSQTIAGCTSANSAPVNVIVTPSPGTPTDATVTANNPSACLASDGSISISGLDPSASYGVQLDSAMVTINRVISANSSGVLTILGLSSGGYTNIILTNELGCSSGTYPGPVVLSDPGAPDAPEGLVADPNPSCLGTVVNLSVTNNPDAEYTWSANSADAGLISIDANTTTMTATAPGVYTILVSQNVAGCISPSAMVDVTVLDIPPTPDATTVIGVDPSDCGVANGTITLSGLMSNESYNLTYSTDGIVSTTSVVADASGEILISGLSAGSYTDFSIENTGGCESGVFPGPISLVEPSAPATPIAEGTDPTDCGVSNGSILVSGLEASSDITLSYSFNGSVITGSFLTSAAGDIVIMNLSSGSYTDFSYVADSGCTSEVLPGPVVLSEPNAPDAPTGLIADPNPVCLGETVNLSVDPVSGATYTWSASSPDAGLVSSSTGNTTTMTATSAGTYNISVSLTIGGCQSAPVSVDVLINAAPDTPIDANITPIDPSSCTTDDGSITIGGYDANADYQLTYSYNAGLPVIVDVIADATGAITISDLPAGNYTEFTLTDANGCVSGTYTGTVTLTQPGAPAAPTNIDGVPNPVCLGNEVALSVDSNPMATYEWTTSSTGAGLTSGTGNTATLNPTSSGIITVSVTQTITGCQSPPTIIEILVLENCLNPDFGVTYNGIDLTGDLSTNDNIVSGTTYGNPQPIGSNPNANLPIVNADGTYTFTTTTVGEWYFLVEVCDPISANGCATEPLAITVLDIESMENSPVANHDYIYTNENTSIPFDILSNDECQSIPSCNLTITNIVEGPFFGSFDITGSVYTPDNDFVGRDSFLYEVCQSPTTTESCDQEWAYIDVFPSFATGFTNAMDDYSQTPLDTELNVSEADGLLDNDSDPTGTSHLVTPFSATANGQGSIVVDSDGSYVFTPASGYIGPVDFQYTVCRGNDGSICDNATLHILVEPMEATGSIGSCVWQDINGNGIFETGEPPVPGVPVNLFTGDGELLGETVTDAQGNYLFSDIIQGVYFLQFELIGEFEFTVANIGAENNDSDVDDSNGSGTTTQFTLLAGQEVTDVKAGLFECTNIGNNLWYDVNENDMFDDSENGINGMQVSLWRRVNGQWVLWDQTTTGQKPNSPSDDGWWNFCTAPGEYYIQVNLPPTGLVQALPFVGNNSFLDSDINNANGPGTTNSFNLQNGIDKLDLGAGYYPEAIVGNLVWHDEDFNGIQNEDEERVAGVLVEVLDATSHEMIGQTTTDEDGIYMLDSLGKRDVYFRFTPPANMVATTADIGTDQIDSDVDHSYGLNTTRMISLQPNSVNNKIDFGVAFGALPVKWVSIDVAEKDDKHNIVWQVEQEIDVEEYVVLRRHESESEFTRINNGKITANDLPTLSKYSFDDADIKRSGQYYYKIQQFDFDGKFNFSRVVTINRKVKLETSLYPNPTSSVSVLTFETAHHGEVSVSISDISGKVVSSIMTNVVEGENTIELDMTSLLPGAYNVKIQLDGQITNKRLIKIK